MVCSRAVGGLRRYEASGGADELCQRWLQKLQDRLNGVAEGKQGVYRGIQLQPLKSYSDLKACLRLRRGWRTERSD